MTKFKLLTICVFIISINTFSNVTLNVLSAYDDETIAVAGDEATIKSKIQNAIKNANDAFTNSKINITLAPYYFKTSENRPTQYKDADVFMFNIMTGKIMKDIITERKRVNADVVFFISKNGFEKGKAFATFGSELSKFPTGKAPSDASFGAYAYAVLKYEYVVSEQLVLAHELGHLLGSDHDRRVACSERCRKLIKDCCYGYIEPIGSNAKERTIMAYPYYNSERIPYYSNPNVSHSYNNNGSPVSWITGVPIGNVNSADNAIVFNEFANTYSSYRNFIDLPPNAFSKEMLRIGSTNDVPKTPYKFVADHFKNGDVIWYVDGSTAYSQTKQYAIPDLVENYMPEGFYDLYIKVRAGVSCNKSSSFTGDCGTLGCTNNDKLTLRDATFQIKTTYNGETSNSLNTVDQNSFTIPFCESIKYSALTDFQEIKIGIIKIGSTALRNNQKLSFEATGLWYDDIAQRFRVLNGVSLHSIKLVYNEPENDGIPWYQDNCPNEYNPVETWTDINGKLHVNEQKDTDLDGIGDLCDICPTDPNNKCNMAAEATQCRKDVQHTFYLDILTLPAGHVIKIDWGDVQYWWDHKDAAKAITSLTSERTLTTTHTWAKNGNYPVTVYEVDQNNIYYKIDDGIISINCPDPDVVPKIDFWDSFNVGDRKILSPPIKTNSKLGINCVVQNTGGRISSWYVDWGDGSAPYIVECDDYPTQSQRLILNHSYSVCNIYTLKVKAIGSSANLVCEKTITINAFTGTTPSSIGFGYFYNWNNNSIGPNGGTIQFWATDNLNVNTKEPATTEWIFGNGAKASGENVYQYFASNEKICPITIIRTSCSGKSTKIIGNDQIAPCFWLDGKITQSTASNVTVEYYPTYNIGSEIKKAYYWINNYERVSPTLSSPSDFHYSYTFERKLTPYNVEVCCRAGNDHDGTGISAPAVTINPIAPVIDFSSSKAVVVNNNPIQFTSSNIGGTVNNWAWDFGDGTSSTDQNPVHIYKKPGVYSVMLKGSGPEFTDAKIKSGYITVKADIIPILQLLLE